MITFSATNKATKYLFIIISTLLKLPSKLVNRISQRVSDDEEGTTKRRVGADSIN